MAPDTLPDIRHAQRTDVSLNIEPNATLKDYFEVCQDILGVLRTEKALKWWIGDFVNFGESKYGEKYAQALDATNFNLDDLTRYAYVCRNVPPNRRVPGLSMSAHYVVARLPGPKQQHYLKKAKDEGLSSATLREIVKVAEPNETKKGRPPKPKKTFDSWLETYFSQNDYSTDGKDDTTRISGKIVLMMQDAWEAAAG